tara:strand:+ start:10516 stop:10746 length:231 start_codon:yes stop_codon:yes gene_type:complete
MLECNLDSKGKALRLVSGIIGVILGMTLLLLNYFEIVSGDILFTIIPFMIFGGSFAIFEGWSGWCLVRALGMRTPI